MSREDVLKMINKFQDNTELFIIAYNQAIDDAIGVVKDANKRYPIYYYELKEIISKLQSLKK